MAQKQTTTPARLAELANFIQRLPAYQPITSSVSDSRWRTQRAHWLSWLKDHGGPGHYKRKRWGYDARFVFNHVGCPVMLLWLIEASGSPERLVLKAKDAILKSTNQRRACAKIRRLVTWRMIQSKLEGS